MDILSCKQTCYIFLFDKNLSNEQIFPSKIQVAAIFEKLYIDRKINIVMSNPYMDAYPFASLGFWERLMRNKPSRILNSFCKWQKMNRDHLKLKNYDVALLLTR